MLQCRSKHNPKDVVVVVKKEGTRGKDTHTQHNFHETRGKWLKINAVIASQQPSTASTRGHDVCDKEEPETSACVVSIYCESRMHVLNSFFKPPSQKLDANSG